MVVAALGHPGRAEIAAAHTRADGQPRQLAADAKGSQRRLDRARFVPGLDAQLLIGLRDAADLIEKIHMPGAAAKLAVGHPSKPDLLLHPDHVADRRILDAAQFLE